MIISLERKKELVSLGFKTAVNKIVSKLDINRIELLKNSVLTLTEDRFLNLFTAERGLDKGLRSESVFMARARDYALARFEQGVKYEYNEKEYYATLYRILKCRLDICMMNKNFRTSLPTMEMLLRLCTLVYGDGAFGVHYPNTAKDVIRVMDRLQAQIDFLIEQDKLEDRDMQFSKSGIAYSSALTRLHNSAIRRGKILHFAYTSDF